MPIRPFVKDGALRVRVILGEARQYIDALDPSCCCARAVSGQAVAPPSGATEAPGGYEESQ